MSSSLKLHRDDQGKPDPNLYWGFFDGRAPVQTRGKWADPNYKLCDRYFICVKTDAAADADK